MNSFSSSLRCFLLCQLLKKSVLSPAEYLDALEGEVLIETAQLEAGAVDVRDGDFSDQTGSSPDAGEVERVVLPQIELQQVEDSEFFLG